MNTEKEKAAELLKKREAARKGLAPKQQKDPIGDEEQAERDVAVRSLGIGLGAKRSG